MKPTPAPPHAGARLISFLLNRVLKRLSGGGVLWTSPTLAVLLILGLALTACDAASSPGPTTPTKVRAGATSVAQTSQSSTTRPEPTRTVVPPSGPAAPPDLSTQADTYLTKLVELRLFNGAALVALDGKVLFRGGYGWADVNSKEPMTTQTRFRLGSITKQFTAMAILILQEQGKLDVQDRICQYLPDCPGAWSAITIHHLLTHTSGIPNFTDFPEYRRWKEEVASPTQTIARFKDEPLDFPPGEAWRYSNSGYIILGSIIEQVASMPYEKFLQEQIFTPLGMANSGYAHNDVSLATGYRSAFVPSEAEFIDMSVPHAAGGLYSTVEDLFLWDRGLYTEQLISQAFLDEMFAPHAQIPESGGLSYGYGWVVGSRFDHRFVEHGGGIEGFATLITRYPDAKVLVVVLSNHEMAANLLDITSHLAELVFDVEH